MPAEPPRSAVHQVQHLIYDGCRILRTRAADTLAPETLAALDAMLAELQPIEGLPIQPVTARHYGLAHGLRTLVEDALDKVAARTTTLAELVRVVPYRHILTTRDERQAAG